MPRLPLFRSVRLWNTEPGNPRRVTWLELFFDLIFVASISQVATALAADYSLPGVLRFAFMLLLIWWAWLGHTMYATRFDSDDVAQRLLTLVQIFAAAAMAANAKSSFDSRDSAGFGAAYAVLRIVLVIQYLRARRLPETRELTSAHAFGFGIAAALWGVAAIIPAPVRFWIWAAALLIDLATPWFAVHHAHKFPPDAEHLPERFGLFTIILLGESVASVMRGMESQEGWPVSAAISAFLGMGISFALWWWYFDVARGAAQRHIRSPRDLARFHVWSHIHFPLYLAIAVSCVGVEHIVSLAPGEHLHHEHVWIFVGAAFAVMACLTTIRLTADAAPGWRDAMSRHLLSATILPAAFFAATIPPCWLVIELAVLCVLHILLPDASPEPATVLEPLLDPSDSR